MIICVIICIHLKKLCYDRGNLDHNMRDSDCGSDAAAPSLLLLFVVSAAPGQHQPVSWLGKK